MATKSIGRGGCVVCTAAAAVEVRAAACGRPARARHHRAPMPPYRFVGRACAPSVRRMPRSVGCRWARLGVAKVARVQQA